MHAMQQRSVWITILSFALAFAACGKGDGDGPGPEPGPDDTHPVVHADRGFGNILIADQWNNRIIEVDSTGAVVWSFGDGSVIAGLHSVVAPNDCERVGELTLIAGSGSPPPGPTTQPACTNPNGCADNRVMLVDKGGNITWQYGQAGVTGAGPNELNVPVSAVMLASGNVLVSDQSNQRVIEITMAHEIVWQYGTTSTTGGSGDNQVNSPNSAQRLANGNTLIADQGNNRVIEVTPDRKVAWSYGTPDSTTILNGPTFASRLPSGNTLIADAGNGRVIEVAPGGTVAWTSTARPGGSPVHVARLANGKTIAADETLNYVYEVDAQGKEVFTYGRPGMLGGSAAGQVNWPYDAKVIGDYTGLTPPR
jgi:hypothetical protein